MWTKHISRSLEDTKTIAENFAATLNPGDVVAFIGEMGAGKTSFTRFALEALGVSSRVQSPTFAIVHEHKILGNVGVYHFDMYRISRTQDLDNTGYFDYLDSQDNILFVEWSENIAGSIPSTARYVKLKILSETEREISIC